jgi:hypothetical protein
VPNLGLVKEIMYGLGDEAPAADTADLMEDILVEYLDETVGYLEPVCTIVLMYTFYRLLPQV